ncbi:MAG: glycosyltransferase, partial [Actinomycetota bacterium]
AAAAGKPVVATDVGGTRDVVRDGQTGFVCPPRDDVGIAARVSELLRDDAARLALGESGRLWVRDRFAADRLVKDIEALYEHLSGQRAGAGRT